MMNKKKGNDYIDVYLEEQDNMYNFDYKNIPVNLKYQKNPKLNGCIDIFNSAMAFGISILIYTRTESPLFFTGLSLLVFCTGIFLLNLGLKNITIANQ